MCAFHWMKQLLFFLKLITTVRKAFVFNPDDHIGTDYSVRATNLSTSAATLHGELRVQPVGHIWQIKSWILPVGICRSYIFYWPNPNRYESVPEENMPCYGFTLCTREMLCFWSKFVDESFSFLDSVHGSLFKRPVGTPAVGGKPRGQRCCPHRNRESKSHAKWPGELQDKLNDACTPRSLEDTQTSLEECVRRGPPWSHPALCTFLAFDHQRVCGPESPEIFPDSCCPQRSRGTLIRTPQQVPSPSAALRLEIDMAFWQAFDFTNSSPVTFHPRISSYWKQIVLNIVFLWSSELLKLMSRNYCWACPPGVEILTSFTIFLTFLTEIKSFTESQTTWIFADLVSYLHSVLFALIFAFK